MRNRGRRERAIAIAWLMLMAPLSLAPTASALDPEIAISQYGHTAWRVGEGHFPGPPNCIAQTSDGYLWLGTDAGLIRFDGVRFTPWRAPEETPLPDGRVFALLGARDGSLWIGTANGLAQWKAGRLTVHATVGRFGALLEDGHGTVWAGHTRAVSELPPLCRAERGDLECVAPSEVLPFRWVAALHEDRRGELWIGGDGGVCRWRAGDPECHPIPGLAELSDKTGVGALAGDADGFLWAGAGTGTWRLAPGGWEPYLGPSHTQLVSYSMLSDPGGGLWIGTFEHGLIRRVRGRTDRFKRADGLSGDAVNDLLEDREGNVWVATSGGLDRFRDLKVTALTQSEGLQSGWVGAVVASRDGGVWIADARALSRLDGGRLSSYSEDQGLPGSSPTSLLEDSRGRLWVGVDNGLAWRDRDRFFRLSMPDGSPLGVIRLMAEDRDGDLWVATTVDDRALVRIRGDRVVEALALDQLAGSHVAAMVADPGGGVWLASGARDPELKRYRDGSLESHLAALGPAGTLTHGMFLDSHGLWVVTNRGLVRLREGRRDVLDTSNGLPCDDVGAAIQSDDGALWLKTSCGLVRIGPGELDSWSESPELPIRVRVLDAFDGARAGMPPFSPLAAKSRDGRLWFATAEGGLQMIDPNALKDNPVPPPVQILRVIADRNNYEPGSPLRLPPLTRDLEIDYTALSLSLPEKVRFRYRLEGVDRVWHDVGVRREAVYTNLGPGSYRFRVIACNNDGVWNEAGATLDFDLLPTFYQTRWFLVLCLAAAGCVAWAGYRWRLHRVTTRLDRRYRDRLAERTRVARELHDTLLGDMAGVAMHLSAASRRAETAGADSTLVGLLAGLGAQVQQALTEARRSVTAMRNPPDEPSSLADRLCESAYRTFAGTGIAVDVERSGTPRPYPESVEAEVLRITTEAMTNARQHADCRRVEISCSYGRRHLQVRVRDDGCGFEPHQQAPTGHWGLVGMRERSAAIGARLAITSAPGAGTEVLLVVPASARRRRWRWTASARSQGT